MALSSRFIYDVQEFKLAIVLVLAETHGVSAVPHPVEQGLILIGAAHSDMADYNVYEGLRRPVLNEYFVLLQDGEKLWLTEQGRHDEAHDQ